MPRDQAVSARAINGMASATLVWRITGAETRRVAGDAIDGGMRTVERETVGRMRKIRCWFPHCIAMTAGAIGSKVGVAGHSHIGCRSVVRVTADTVARGVTWAVAGGMATGARDVRVSSIKRKTVPRMAVAGWAPPGDGMTTCAVVGKPSVPAHANIGRRFVVGVARDACALRRAHLIAVRMAGCARDVRVSAGQRETGCRMTLRGNPAQVTVAVGARVAEIEVRSCPGVGKCAVITVTRDALVWRVAWTKAFRVAVHAVDEGVRTVERETVLWVSDRHGRLPSQVTVAALTLRAKACVSSDDSVGLSLVVHVTTPARDWRVAWTKAHGVAVRARCQVMGCA